MKSFAIAMDGPAGSGKSSVAKIIAERLNIFYVDTGAMYRAVGLYCSQRGIDTKDEGAVEKVLDQIQLEIGEEKGKQVLYLNGENVSQKIRSEEAGAKASDVASILAVRQKLVEIQRKLATGHSVIMDGRDIGTNVLPNAAFKFYISASLEERIRRRYLEFANAKEKVSYDEVRSKVIKRDEQDTTRIHNPLCKAEDAIEIDTSQMSLEEVVTYIIDIIQSKIEE